MHSYFSGVAQSSVESENTGSSLLLSMSIEKSKISMKGQMQAVSFYVGLKTFGIISVPCSSDAILSHKGGVRLELPTIPVLNTAFSLKLDQVSTWTIQLAAMNIFYKTFSLQAAIYLCVLSHSTVQGNCSSEQV